MSKIRVKDLVLGSGRPKIAVPLLEPTLPLVLKAARKVVRPAVDLVEWRIDGLSQLNDVTKLVAAAHQLRALLAPRPLLITLRTRAEGGRFSGNDQLYFDVYRVLMEEQCMDLLDLELMSHPSVIIQQLVKLAHRNHIKVIMSRHNFKQTPSTSELFGCLKKMEWAGGDVAKIAVMPNDANDVLRLLEVTNNYHLRGQLPLISMAMGELGKITRISGELFGSCVTFASLAQASAPGQIDLDHLVMMMKELNVKDR